MVAEPPQLLPAARQAAHAWRFCGGFVPERWPVYAALHAVDDWDVMVHCMEVIRDNTHGH